MIEVWNNSDSFMSSGFKLDYKIDVELYEIVINLNNKYGNKGLS